MRCGNKNCQNDRHHDTVEQVRACYGVTPTTSPNHPTAEDLRVSELKARLPEILVQDWEGFRKIPAGFYATPSLTGNNDLDFWRVEKGKGRWEGYTFIKRVIGGHDDASIPRDSKRRVKTEKVPEKITQAKAFAAILDLGVDESTALF